MKKLYLLLVLLIPSAFALCTSNLPSLIGSSVTLCGQNYTLNEPIVISGSSDLTVDCQGAMFSGISPTGFLVESLVDVTLKDCGFRGLDVGIYVNHSKSTSIYGGLFDANGRGIYARPTSGTVSVANARFFSHKQEAVGLATSGKVENNHFEKNMYGIYLFNISSGALVSQNTFTENGYGAFIEGKKHLISENTFSQDSLSLLFAQQIQIKDNTFDSSPSNGLSALHSLGLLISKNSFTLNKESGVILFSVSDSSLSENVFSKNGVAGIFLTKDSNRNVLKENTFSSNSFYGIFLNESSQNRITENSFVGTSLVIDASIGNEFCPANTYAQGARGPTCEKKTSEPAIEKPKKVISEPIIAQTLQQSPQKTSSLPPVATSRELSTALSPLQVRSVLERITSTGSPIEIGKMAEKIKKTMEKLTLQKKLTTHVSGNEVLSNITTTLVFKETMHQLAIYEFIPKSCAQDASDITPIGDARFEVLEDDPLIVWRFEKVEAKDRINVGYTVRNQVTELPKTLVIEEDDGSIVVNEGLICADVPQTVPVAQKIGSASSWFLLIPLSLLMLGAFFVSKNRFTKSP